MENSLLEFKETEISSSTTIKISNLSMLSGRQTLMEKAVVLINLDYKMMET
jgi:hypothetical protein